MSFVFSSQRKGELDNAAKKPTDIPFLYGMSEVFQKTVSYTRTCGVQTFFIRKKNHKIKKYS